MNFVTKEPINKGWSSDKKYCVTDENGTRYLLRVSDIAQHDTKQSEFNMMKQVASFGVPMCQPIEFGTCEDGVYSIQSWIDGKDAEQVMSGYSDIGNTSLFASLWFLGITAQSLSSSRNMLSKFPSDGSRRNQKSALPSSIHVSVSE